MRHGFSPAQRHSCMCSLAASSLPNMSRLGAAVGENRALSSLRDRSAWQRPAAQPQPPACLPDCSLSWCAPAEVQVVLVAPQHAGPGLHGGLGQHVVQVDHLVPALVSHYNKEAPLPARGPVSLSSSGDPVAGGFLQTISRHLVATQCSSSPRTRLSTFLRIATDLAPLTPRRSATVSRRLASPGVDVPMQPCAHEP